MVDATRPSGRPATRKTPRIMEDASRPGERNGTHGGRIATWRMHLVLADAARQRGRHET